MQRIVIKNFGPLTDVDLEIKDLMLFIGPQASGKSTIAKLIYFFRSIPSFLEGFFTNYPPDANFRPNLEQSLMANLMSLFMDSFISYRDKLSVIELCLSNERKITFNLSESDILISGLDDVFEKVLLLNSEKQSTKESKLKHIFDETFGNFNSDPLFIPTNRASLSTRVGFQNILETNYLINLIPLKGSLKDGLKVQLTNKVSFKILMEKVKSILKVNDISTEYEGQPNKPWVEYLHLDKNVKIKLEEASSGQQESLWMILLLILLDQSGSPLTIEEPELSLYPESQKHLVDLFGLYLNAHKNNQLVITTHSPHILAAFDNLIYASLLAKEKPEKRDEISKVVDENFWFDPQITEENGKKKCKRLGVYAVDNGTVEEIFDYDLNMIKNDELEKIRSDSHKGETVIEKDFNKLSEIKWGD